MDIANKIALTDEVAHRLDIATELVEKHYGVTLAQIRGKDRHTNLIHGRRAFMVLLRKCLGFSYMDAGMYCHRTHATIINAVLVHEGKKHNGYFRDRYLTQYDKLEAEYYSIVSTNGLPIAHYLADYTKAHSKLLDSYRRAINNGISQTELLEAYPHLQDFLNTLKP